MKVPTKYFLIPLLAALAVFTAACLTVTVSATPTPAAEKAAVVTPSPSETFQSPTLTPQPATPTSTATPTATPTPKPTDTPAARLANTPTPKPTATPTPKPSLPFEGVFKGTAAGDDGSSASLTLDLTQRGQEVSGLATLGEGLRVNVGGGFCPGVQSVPPASVEVSGQTSPNNPRRIESSATMTVSGFNIVVSVVADVSADGEDLTALITLQVPFPCRSPQLPARLTRQE